MRPSSKPDFRKTADTFRAGAKTLAQPYFVAPSVFAQEQERIFSRRWLCVGHQSQLPNAGDYFLQDVAGESLIVLRDQHQEVRAFYNVCRHRGTRMCEQTRGHFQTVQCPYHAWTYQLDGRLAGAPHMDEVAEFDKAAHSLVPVALGIWEGLLFVNLSDQATPLQKSFEPLAGKFTEWNLPRLRSARRIEYDVRANWKLVCQNYSECYHCPLVHPTLAKLSPSDAAENDLFEGPFLGGPMPIRKGRSLTMSGQACARPVGERPEAQTDADPHRIFYYSIFPNLLLSLHPDYVMVHQLWPQAPDRVRIVCDWLFHPEAFGQHDFRPDDAIIFWDMTNRQDWRVCELSQQGIASRAYQPGPYSPRESIPAAWDREYLRALQESPR